MKIGILQPGYLPWLGFFEQMCRTDIFVIYDDVQYDKNGWRNRNKIKTPQGEQWLTVPVLYKYEEKPRVDRVRIDPKSDWRKKHCLSIRYNYARAPYFKGYFPIFEEAYAKDWEFLIDLDMFFIRRLAAALGIDDSKIVRSSSLDLTGDRLERLVKICKHFKADVFYEGASGKEYIEDACFSSEGVTVEYQDYRHPVYAQLHGVFVPYLSVIDLLFNHGQESLSIILNEQIKETA